MAKKVPQKAVTSDSKKAVPKKSAPKKKAPVKITKQVPKQAPKQELKHSTVDLLRLPALERERPARQKLMTREDIVRMAFWALAALSLVVLVVNAIVAGRSVVVPDVVGMSRTEALDALEARGLQGVVARERFSSAPKDQIVEQQPLAGEQARRGTNIQLVASNGIEGFSIPDVTGEELSVARAELEDLGLMITVIEAGSDKEPGTVLSTEPAAGTQARYGDPIFVQVAARSTGSGLVDFRLSGKRIVIEPRYTSTTAGDVTFETARRLSSLFKAAGATVTVTRSSSERQISTTTYTQRASAANPNVYIVLSVSSGAQEGIAIVNPSSDERSLGNEASNRLKASLATEVAMSEGGNFGPATPGLTAEVILGSTASQNDQILFGDSQWVDRVARALYMAAGTAIRSNVR